jgi:hypothetical protein
MFTITLIICSSLNWFRCDKVTGVFSVITSELQHYRKRFKTSFYLLVSKCKRVKTPLSKELNSCKPLRKNIVFHLQKEWKLFQKSEIPLFEGAHRGTAVFRAVLLWAPQKSAILLFWSGFHSFQVVFTTLHSVQSGLQEFHSFWERGQFHSFTFRGMILSLLWSLIEILNVHIFRHPPQFLELGYICLNVLSESRISFRYRFGLITS